jgi:hypothetical protein
MKVVTSVSGGKTSAYIAANYHSDYLVFALVRTNDKSVAFKDKYLKKMVEDKLQCDFVGTLESDTIISTMFDLEQYTGKKIDWVSGDLFEDVIAKRKMIPNKMMRFCTTELKMKPIFHWWSEKFSKEPVEMNIGYRVTEQRRAKKMLDNCNENGLNEFKATFGKHPDGRNKWEVVEWRKPKFPLIPDMIDQHDIRGYWEDKPVRFSDFNNCIGCPNFTNNRLKYSSENYPDKFKWFINQEEHIKGTWKTNITYKLIKNMPKQLDIFKGEIGCDSGFCGM